MSRGLQLCYTDAYRREAPGAREVGSIRVTGYESKGRINKRIRIELVDAS